MKFAEILSDCQSQAINIETACGINAVQLAPVLEQTAYCLHALGRLDEAQAAYERAFAIHVLARQHCSELALNCVHSLGLLHRLQNNLMQAEIYYKHAVDISTALYGGSDPRTARRRNFLAGLYYNAGRFKDASELIARSRCDYESASTGTVTIVLCSLAQALSAFRDSRRKEGDAFLKEASILMRDLKNGGGQSDGQAEDTAIGDLLEFVMVQLRQSNFEDSEALFRYILLNETRELWPKHPLVAKNMKRAGDLHRAFGQMEKAAVIYRSALDIYMSSLGEADAEIADLAEKLGRVCVELKDIEQARFALQLAIDMREIFKLQDGESYAQTQALLGALPAK